MTILQNARQDLVKATFILNALGTYIDTDRKCYTVSSVSNKGYHKPSHTLSLVYLLAFDTRESTGTLITTV